MKHAAFLVDVPDGTFPKESVFIDCAKAVDYAATHHGSVSPLVQARHMQALQVKIDAVKKLAESGPAPMIDGVILAARDEEWRKALKGILA
jgi:hypothetical protein